MAVFREQPPDAEWLLTFKAPDGTGISSEYLSTATLKVRLQEIAELLAYVQPNEIISIQLMGA